MKMKELERATGISREAIRFYIREGLLPEPERPKKNVARYHQGHVDGLRTIKQLQEEQLLPLDVIKAFMTSKMELKGLDAQALQGIALALEARFSADDGQDGLTLRQAAKKSGLSKRDIIALEKVGMIAVQEDEAGEKTLAPGDWEILVHWGQLTKAGFSKSRGFHADMAQLYVQFTQWLADQEASLFLKHMSGQLSSEEAAAAAADGITHLNAVLGLMRKRALLARLKEAGQKSAGKRKRKPQKEKS